MPKKSLIPFAKSGIAEAVEVFADVRKVASRLQLEYEVRGVSIARPKNSGPPSRMHELWQDTCFELFFGPKVAPNYWEINISPRGHWNIYHFDDYRSGMREEESYTALASCTEYQADCFKLSASIPLSTIVEDDVQLEAAPSVVLKSPDGSLSYWALAHSPARPDFHDRRHFLLELQ